MIRDWRTVVVLVTLNVTTAVLVGFRVLDPHWYERVLWLTAGALVPTPLQRNGARPSDPPRENAPR